MDREELMKELEDLFQDEPDNNKLNAVLDLADAYAEYEYDYCWERPEDAGVIYHSKLDGACCTLCALKKGAGRL